MSSFRDKAYWLAGTRDTMRMSHAANEVAELIRWADKVGLDNFAIFRQASGFHSTTQREFLVYHHNDPYFTAQGVPSGRLLQRAA